MYLGYNTNGLAHHDLLDAVELLHEIGYRGVAVTIDHGVLSPRDPGRAEQLGRLGRLLERFGMRSVIETGARYLLDLRTKHEPTLLSKRREERIAFYRYAVDCAAELGSDCVSLWSGRLIEENPNPFLRLADGLRDVLNYAAARNVAIAFEPEPGMLVDTMASFKHLLQTMQQVAGAPECNAGPVVNSPESRSGDDLLCLTLDMGHLQCQGETPISDVIRRWASRLVNVHIEDMRLGLHEHLMFGEGEIDFPPVLHALNEVGYQGGVFVELPRHSHEGPAAARRAFEFLTPLIARLG
ncbi:MAG: sugar phosphate isomerase/epimerase family protein [Thermoguttaceae bacterium]